MMSRTSSLPGNSSQASPDQVLIVDDNVANVKVIQELLLSCKNPISSEYAISGADALNLVDQRIFLHMLDSTPIYKLIIMDFSMAGISGTQTAKKILEKA